MSKTLYFAKININSESTFKSYKGEADLDKIMYKLGEKIKNNIKYVNTIEKIVDNETKVTEELLEFTGINQLEIDSKKIVVGNIVKSAKVFVNNVNKSTGEIVTSAVDNDEIVKFCFYPSEEIVAFYSANRFGYQKFKECFEVLINKCYDDEFFKVSLMNSGLSIENIKESLKKIKNIEELKIDIIPPNPGKKLMKHLKENAEKKIKSMESGRITEQTISFRSNYPYGLETESEEIDKAIYELTSIHTKLSLEESTKKGYVNIEARSKSGEIYNTDNNKLLKYKIPKNLRKDDSKFARCCKDVIDRLIK